MNLPDIEQHLIDRIRLGETQAWQDFIDRFEGRLFSYVHLRKRRPDHSPRRK
jgi:hypothetical protein